MNLMEELRLCQHVLVESELESARHGVFNYAVQKINETAVTEILDQICNKLRIAAEVNLAFRIILKNTEDWKVTCF